ncbi:MAG: Rv2175c family DNA-binding protein [Ornithinimicrobium sp.]
MLSDTNVILDGEWLTVPDIMERAGASLATVRTWLEMRDLIGMRRGPNRALMVPAGFVSDAGPMKALRGTFTVLADSGLSDDEILQWLGEVDESWTGGSAMGALHAGHKTEVRRRAMEVAS